MTNDWILDVIRDLRRFADLNGLSQLSRQLDIAAETAMREIPELGERGSVALGGDADGRAKGTRERVAFGHDA